jgi:nucleoside 2-deoxyribosyltransferase
MRVLYIAGPYEASTAWLTEHNVRSAEAVALRVWSHGYVALCPHAMTRFYGGALSRATWLAGDLELLSRCDGVLMLEHWERSEGAMGERAFALAKGIPVFATLAEVDAKWKGNGDAGNVTAPTV